MGYDVFERCRTTGAFRHISNYPHPSAASAAEVAMQHMAEGYELLESGADVQFAALKESASGRIVLIVVQRHTIAIPEAIAPAAGACAAAPPQAPAELAGACDGPFDTRQRMRLIAREIRNAGFRLVMQRLLDPISGESLHACTAVFRRTGEMWRVTARDAYAAIVELARQVGAKLTPVARTRRARPARGAKAPAMFSASSSLRHDDSFSYGVLTVVAGLTGYLASAILRQLDRHLRDQSSM